MSVFVTPKGALELRELHTMAEMESAEQIQLVVWGAEIHPHPKEMLIPIQHEGGLLAGAFTAQGELVSMVFGFPTRDPAVQHSQMLATVPAWRGNGIAAQLKWFQRDWCLARGIQTVRWTVDPLRAVNAELNYRFLGAISNQYLPDYYGAMQGIDAGAPTDRLLMVWELAGRRAAQRAAATPPDQGFPAAQYAFETDGDTPLDPQPGLDGPVLIRLPEDFIQLSRQDPALALAWRSQTRALFQAYFARGYRASEFTRVGGPACLLEPQEGANVD